MLHDFLVLFTLAEGSKFATSDICVPVVRLRALHLDSINCFAICCAIEEGRLQILHPATHIRQTSVLYAVVIFNWSWKHKKKQITYT